MGSEMSFGDIYRGRRVLLTGHTGFKGSWLAAWLEKLGAELCGISLPPPTAPNHFDLIRFGGRTCFVDLRDRAALADAVRSFAPEIVFHLAAQALVLPSYEDPVATFECNVMGTLHLLDALRGVPQCRAAVIVTSDKCYENRESGIPFREGDPLGGADPYSASKGCAEIAVASWRRSFLASPESPLIATARAGNVVGGGDWAAHRLIPDLARAAAAGRTEELRRPQAVRPFQHVLDPLAGYLELGRRLWSGDRAAASAWNFGPPAGGELTVARAAELFAAGWPAVRYRCAENTAAPPEASLLRLDTSRAERELGIRNIWSAERCFERTARWYRDFYASRTVDTADDLVEFETEAARREAPWTR